MITTKRFVPLLALLLLVSTFTACAGRQKVPVKASLPTVVPTRAEEVVDLLHGVPVKDPYRWLESEKQPEVQAWVEAQDAATREWLGANPSRQALADRFRALFYLDSISAPMKRGSRYFYSRTHADKEKAIVYWREGLEGEERVLLDPNGWSADGTVSLGRWVPSWDGSRVVFARRENGKDEATLYVLDVDSGKESDVDVIPGGKYATPSWTPDGTGFYYEWLPTDPSIPVDERPGYTELRWHELGTDPKNDPIIHERTGNPSTFLGGQLSRDGRFLFVYVFHGWNESDIWFKEVGKDEDFRLLIDGDNATYEVEPHGDDFYVLTNEGAPRKRIFRVSAANPARENWQEIVPEDPVATIEGSGVMGGRLVVVAMKDAANVMKTYALDGSDAKDVKLPGIGSVHGLYGNFDEDEAFFSFSSFTTPTSVYRMSVSELTRSLWAQVSVDVDVDAYSVSQVFFSSKDGTRVPMFLVHRKDVTPGEASPTLLYGYGGFDVSLTPVFRTSIYPWLEAGGVYAVANLRGGGEYGKAWHDAGKGANKQNVFDDFTAAAEYLIDQGWTSPDKLAIYGGSNGGLLVGAAMTQRPELYGAVVCAVPLLDMVRYHLFGSGRTWVPEYGSAEDPQQFQTLYAYSPYHRVEETAKYPALLMLAADHDDRVDPMHARKFVAALQATGSPALLRVERNAGHGGADQVSKAIEQSADMYTFLFNRFGMTPGGATR